MSEKQQEGSSSSAPFSSRSTNVFQALRYDSRALAGMTKEEIMANVELLAEARSEIIKTLVFFLLECGMRPAKPQLGNESMWLLRDIVDRVQSEADEANEVLAPGAIMTDIRVEREQLRELAANPDRRNPFGALIISMMRNAMGFQPEFELLSVRICDVVVELSAPMETEEREAGCVMLIARIVLSPMFAYRTARTPTDVAAERFMERTRSVPPIDIAETLRCWQSTEKQVFGKRD